VHRVRVEPAGLELLAAEGQTLMAAANAAGRWWPTVCGGNGTCRTCFAVVTAGAEHLSPVGSLEAEGLALLGVPTRPGEQVRLACQAQVHGAVVARKAGVRLID
jgi:ferredoxin